MSEERNPIGRPSKFNVAVKEKILELGSAGKTEEQIAEIIGIHVNTLRNWKGKHPDFMWALNESKQVADDLVEASLFSRAVGYSHREEKVFCHEGMIITHETMKQYPPDVTAAIFWLKNRKPDEWRDKHQMALEGGGEDSAPLKLDLSAEKLIEVIRIARGEK
jgi:transposase-like protein